VQEKRAAQTGLFKKQVPIYTAPLSEGPDGSYLPQDFYELSLVPGTFEPSRAAWLLHGVGYVYVSY